MTNRHLVARTLPWLWSYFFVLVGGGVLLWGGGSYESFESGPPLEAASHSPQTPPQYATTAIEELRVGDWVLARNPEVSEDERAAFAEVDPEKWRKLALRMTKPGGGRLDITLLRPAAWLEENGAQVGYSVELDLAELGASGWAEVLSIDPCPEIGPPPAPGRQVITATFAHQSAEVLEVAVEGLEEPLGVTANHPLWSEDRQAFVPAGRLRPGERLRTAAGTFSRITSITPRGPPQPVYNLEVNGEHVYYVSKDGLLAHNTYTRRQALNVAKQRAGVPKSQQPSRQWTVGNNRMRRGHKNYRYSDDPATHGRYYEYDTPRGKRVIADHTNDPNRGSHTHAGQPKGDPSRSNVDFKSERYQQVDGHHHIDYGES